MLYLIRHARAVPEPGAPRDLWPLDPEAAEVLGLLPRAFPDPS